MIPRQTSRPLALVAAGSILVTACGGSTTSESVSPATSITIEVAATTTSPSTTQSIADDTDNSLAGDDILTNARNGSVALGEDEPMRFVEFGLEMEFDLFGETTPALLGVFADEGVVIVPFDLVAEEPVGQLLIITPDGDALLGEGLELTETADGGLTAAGELQSDSTGEQISFTLDFAFGAGTSTFELAGHRAVVRGDLGSNTLTQMQYLIEAHPEVDTLVLLDVPGSVDDEINMETGRLVRAAKYTVIVPSNGEIASGGVDLFAAGSRRIVEAGATLGIHSWCCGPAGESAGELDRDDSAHEAQIAYFTEMLGPDLGPQFYFATLDAAPFDDIHYMTAEEIARYHLTTER